MTGAEDELLAADAVVRRLHGLGLTDVEIAERTGWSTCTVCRARSALGLRPNARRSRR